jgi:membrane-associated phospholipid phosphatase
MARLSRAAWVLIALALLFFGISLDLLSGGPLTTLDVHIADWMRTHRDPALSQALLVVTHAHAQAAVLACAALLTGYFTWRRRWVWALCTLTAVPGAIALNPLLKLLFERARPQWNDPLLSLSSYSFPSGHTAGATALYGLLAAYAFSRTSSLTGRAAAVSGALAMVALVALSRMVLGVHYLSDVLAAACSSAFWLVLCLAVVHAAAARRRQPESG